jgi:hypothetical protein
MQREDAKEPRVANLVLALAAGAYIAGSHGTMSFATKFNHHYMLIIDPPATGPTYYVFTQVGFTGQYLSPYLQDLALAAFDDFILQDASSISRWLACNVKPSVPGYDYGTVAEDLLAWLARHGLIKQDEHGGWYRKVKDHDRNA